MGILDMFGIGPVATVVDDILKMFPNAEQRAALQEKLQDLAKAIVDGQNTTNAAEAATGNLFIAGWRPFVGWTCALGFFGATTYSLYMAWKVGTPYDTTLLTNTLWGMLGLGAMRSGEKLAGVATTAIKRFIK